MLRVQRVNCGAAGDGTRYRKGLRHQSDASSRKCVQPETEPLSNSADALHRRRDKRLSSPTVTDNVESGDTQTLLAACSGCEHPR
jgi:hypothetical protein